MITLVKSVARSRLYWKRTNTYLQSSVFLGKAKKLDKFVRCGTMRL